MKKVRTRYAPSPTGFQHIGGIRTALFNYFFAKANGGDFLLRIEDTDRVRYSVEALEDIETSFKFLGIEYDEKHIQSERFELYKEMAFKLIEKGKAYKCYCSQERLDNLREKQSEDKVSNQGYDRLCRTLDKKEINENEKNNLPFTIRLKIELGRKIKFHDEILGDQEWESDAISPDPILLKSDGFPTYHLANIVDDHLMEISHVLRAQEWLPSTPLHILLYEAFEWTPPKFCHLPMVMGEDGKKLSKRHGSVSLREFIKEGYLKEAIINYITLLGFSPKSDEEFFTFEEFSKIFKLEGISKSPAIFDYKKLKHFNFHYITALSKDEFLKKIIPYLEESKLVSSPITNSEYESLEKSYMTIKERIFTLSESSEIASFVFTSPSLDAVKPQITKSSLELFLSHIDTLENTEVEEKLKEIAKDNGMKIKDFFMPIRLALTGTPKSPPIADVMKIIGKEEVKKRIKLALEC